MLKQLKRVMVLIGCFMIFAGCGKKEYTAADFIGVWDSDYELGSETIEFFKDGTFGKDTDSILGSFYLTGTYQVEENKVTVAFDQTGGIDVYEFKFVNDTKMIWTMGDIDFTYIKR